MKYIEDLKNASVAEFDKAEADWRETVGRIYENVTECEDVPTPEELDDVDHAIAVIDRHVEQVKVSANDWIVDTIEWGKVAKARIEAKKKTVKAEA